MTIKESIRQDRNSQVPSLRETDETYWHISVWNTSQETLLFVAFVYKADNRSYTEIHTLSGLKIKYNVSHLSNE